MFVCILTLILPQAKAQQSSSKQVETPRIASLKEKGRLPNQGYIARAIDLGKLTSTLQKAGLSNYLEITQPHFKSIRLNLPYQLIDSLLIQPGLIDFIDIHRMPREESIIPGFDPTANKLNRLFSQYNHFNGNGLVLSIKEKRFDSLDIDLVNRVKASAVGAAEVTSHATRMATMAAGAGNSMERSKGAAWGAQLFSASFDNLMPEDPLLYRNESISVQNHSYGTAIENFYGADAAAYDEVAYQLPYLLHVFSAGNLGEEKPAVGIYKNLPWANLSGSFKMSKNSLTVGAIDSFFKVESRSSKGPAYDGRIKPELVAFGQDGSSGAAAIVSGISVSLQQLYASKHNQLPPSSLIKAVLMNSATDLLTPGPDFQSGFGNADALQALTSMEAGDYLLDSAMHNETKVFFLDVPPGSNQLKLLLSWVDPPSAPNISKALVNDLDLVATDPLSNETLPWILSSFADADSLALAAKRGKDTLNNMEQVTIDDPLPGKYTIRITAAVKTGKQPFALTWLIKKDTSFSWSYPVTPDKLISRTNSLFRWNEGLKGQGTLYYRILPGDWQTVKTIDLSVPYTSMMIPDSTGLIQFSMQQGSARYLSDTFAIFKETVLQVGYVCRDSFMLYWKDQGADSFRLFRLGERYLDPIFEGMDSTYTGNVDQHKYFAVAPMVKGIEGNRSLTRQYELAGVGCYLKSFLVDLVADRARLSLELSTLVRLDSLLIEKLQGPQWITIARSGTPTVASHSYIDSGLEQGLNRYRVRIRLQNGSSIYSPEEQLFYFLNKDFILYPNPAPRNGRVNLAIRDTEDLWIAVFDLLGRKWINRKVDDLGEKLSLAGLPAGIYFYRFIKEGKQSGAGRLVIQ